MTPHPAISAIGQIHINVRQLDRAVAFYRDTLGLPFLFQVPNMAFFQCGEVRLMLGVAEQPAFDHPASILYYRVEDIDPAYRTLVDRGVTSLHEPARTHETEDHVLWLAFLKDSEENTIALMCERPKA
ncbi:MAG TPA: VOC family protein [Gemmatimonadales bacterium]